MRVRCRLFARYAEVLETTEVVLDLPAGSLVGDAIAQLRSTVPNGHLLPNHPLVALNRQHALPGLPLADGDEIALLPPLAGG